MLLVNVAARSMVDAGKHPDHVFNYRRKDAGQWGPCAPSSLAEERERRKTVMNFAHIESTGLVPNTEQTIIVPAVIVASARFIKVELFCKITGWSEKAVYNKRTEGIWREGKGQIIRKRRGTLLIDMEAYNRWVEEEEDRDLE
jgi:hypothetical protein